ncbi:dienelactone hydrolase family protein [bacterium BFN5]|nr:dienelactone hydrolase family protein [bacterium BFN5]
MRILLILVVLLSISTSTVLAQIRGEVIEYKQGTTVLEGYLAYDDSIKGKRPGVLVVHDWLGVGPYVRARAQQLASLGYIAFAPDIYGKDIRPADNKEAAKISNELRNDRMLLRLRVNAGLDILRNHPLTDPDKLGAIGYCFGGMTVLELARSGANIAGVVSFHGNLDTPADTSSIHTKVLVLHGAEDPIVPPAQVAAFENEMRKANVDWQLNVYSGAAHNFTNPNSPAYNRQVDRRSFEAMKAFFREIFAQ